MALSLRQMSANSESLCGASPTFSQNISKSFDISMTVATRQWSQKIFLSLQAKMLHKASFTPGLACSVGAVQGAIGALDDT
jgi:hypothetical protein